MKSDPKEGYLPYVVGGGFSGKNKDLVNGSIYTLQRTIVLTIAS